MRARRLRPLGLLCVVAAAVTLAGCGGPKTAIVRGQVTYKGKAIPNGSITFLPASGPTATGEIQGDGSYTLTTYKSGDGALPGKYTVVIVAMQKQRAGEEFNPTPPPIIPLKYTSASTTDLKADVQLGENTINFELKDDKKK